MTPTQIFEGYAALTTVVAPAIIAPVIIDDPDDAVLACAVAANLMKLVQYEGIPIVAPAEAVERLGL